MILIPFLKKKFIDKATSEKLTSEDWEIILEICDKVTEKQESGATECFAVINKRLLNRNPNVVYYTLSLVESLVKNCGTIASEQVASRYFTTTLIRILSDKTVNDQIKKRILGNIQQWAFDFRQDPGLSLMEETFKNLQTQGFVFPKPQKPQKIPKQDEISKRQEEEDLLLALALSLSDADNQKQTPAMIRKEIGRQKSLNVPISSIQNPKTQTNPNVKSPEPKKDPTKVRALFDFTPTETGELGFVKGDVIVVLDQKYRDWWTGELRGKRGIFPANFVQQVKDIKPEQKILNDFEELVTSEAHNIEVLLRMLSRLDPQNDSLAGNTEIQSLYSSTLSLRPKIVKLIEEFSAKKDNLVNLNNQLTEAMGTYEMLMANSKVIRHGHPNQQYANHTPNNVQFNPNQHNMQNFQQNQGQILNPQYQQPINQSFQQTPADNSQYPYNGAPENPNLASAYHGYSSFAQPNQAPNNSYSTQVPHGLAYQADQSVDGQYLQGVPQNIQSANSVAAQKSNQHSVSPGNPQQMQPGLQIGNQGYVQDPGYNPSFVQNPNISHQNNSNQQYIPNREFSNQSQQQNEFYRNN
ncbi:Class E vacuolar protein-sorting machinery protein HSE1 [Smittium culicis]|uniref:Class E vacuolar protein-sorting machinery protein HSE1 n=1 Tax=Smittium culicis TaxID=133412 RepID=A0A1R1Y053_9FUNG|nr:Class E vacuolar protein-sorting machinery protein HSE1 [Smittium culicis]